VNNSIFLFRASKDREVCQIFKPINNLAGMFTGIIEDTGTITSIDSQGNNKSFWITSGISDALRVDQSVSHDGVCLTVEQIQGKQHRVTAVAETLTKSNLSTWQPGLLINLERSLQLNDRIDGHLVQGHVDTTARCVAVSEKDGSWQYRFSYPPSFNTLIIEKGSISINGISLTAFNVNSNEFEVAIIPYTYEHTNIRNVKKGSIVNLEFDLLGKYINRIYEVRK
jgi:riboflavin synthase